LNEITNQLRLNLVFVIPLLPAPMPPVTVAAAMSAPQPVLERRVLAMGTELSLHLEGANDLSRASEAALAESSRIEKACSTWDSASQWSRLNAAQGRPVALAPEWIHLLTTIKAWTRRTEGTFDPVLWALIQAWGTRHGGTTPTQQDLSKAREASGAGLLHLDPAAGTVQLGHPSAGVEEGGFLKGYALDRMKAVAPCAAGLLDFGGQLLAWGKPVKASVADPQNRQQARLTLTLYNASLSSSGTSERGRHILDPRSGLPCEAWGSVAVVAPSGLEADVLSTALYVMGPELGLAWAERQGVAAAFLLNGGSIRLSSALQAFHPLVHKEHP
jgi:thiamine biosynthesis lipoprotein